MRVFFNNFHFDNFIMRVGMFYKKLFLQFMTLTLGFFSLANAYQLHGVIFIRNIATVFAISISLVFLFRCLLFPKVFIQEINHAFYIVPYQTGIMGLFFASEVMSIYIKSFFPQLLWGFALVLNTLLILNFFKIYLLSNFTFSNFTPIWYLMVLGIVAGGLTGYQMGYHLIGEWIIGYGVVGFILMTPPMLIRIIHGTPLSDDVQPIKGVMCAAPALLLVALLSTFNQIPLWFSLSLLTMSQVFLLWIYRKAFFFIRIYFCQNYCSLTFPLGISCTALFIFRSHYIPNEHFLFKILGYLGYVELAIATLVIPIIIFLYFFQAHKEWARCG